MASTKLMRRLEAAIWDETEDSRHRELVRGMLDTDPTTRWTIGRVAEFLEQL